MLNKSFLLEHLTEEVLSDLLLDSTDDVGEQIGTEGLGTVYELNGRNNEVLTFVHSETLEREAGTEHEDALREVTSAATILDDLEESGFDEEQHLAIPIATASGKDSNGAFYLARMRKGNALVSNGLPNEDILFRIANGDDPTETIVQVGLDISIGLECLHSHGYVHRSVGLDSIFYNRKGDRRINFTLGKIDSCRIKHSTEQCDIALSSTISSAGWMDATDPTRDIYALGAVLYIMLDSFYNENINLMQERFEQYSKTQLTDTGDWFIPPVYGDDKLHKIIRKALTPDKDLNYQSIADLRVDLVEYDTYHRNSAEQRAQKKDDGTDTAVKKTKRKKTRAEILRTIKLWRNAIILCATACLCVAAIVHIHQVAVLRTVKENIEADLASGQYNQAVSLYNDAVYGSQRRQEEVDGLFLECIQNIENQYESDEIEYQIASGSLQTLESVNDEDISSTAQISLDHIEELFLDQENFNDGVQALERGDYIAALSTLLTVPESSKHYSEAQAKGSQCCDTVVKSAKEKNDLQNYLTIIEQINSVPINRGKIEECRNLLASECTALATARVDELFKEGDMKSCISLLNDVLSTYNSTTLLERKSSIETQFVDSVAKASKANYYSSGAEKAIETVDGGLASVPNNSKLVRLKDLYKSVESVPAESVTYNCDQYVYFNDKAEDSYGNQHTGTIIKFELFSWIDTYRWIEFTPSEKYQKFTANIFVGEMLNKHWGQIQFFCDGKLVYDTGELPRTHKCTPVSIDLSGVYSLEIKATTSGLVGIISDNPNPAIYLENPMMTTGLSEKEIDEIIQS